MTRKKEAPGVQSAQGQKFITKESYHTAPGLSTAERVAKHRADMPELYRKMFDRCTSGKASPREAIKMQCLECWGYVRAETTACDNCACPLFAYRPYQTAPDGRQDDLNGVESTNDGKGV